MPDPSFQSDQPKPARRKVATGIYERQTAAGVVHDVNYTDRTGKLRWVVVHDHRISEAKRRRAELISKRPEDRREPSRKTFAEAAEAWWEQKMPKLRGRTASYYRTSLDLVLLPAFGRVPLGRIDVEAIARFIRDLQREGLHAVDPARPVRPLSKSSVENYTKPLQQTLAFAARRGWIVSSPWLLLTTDDMPTRNGEERRAHEWTTEELAGLLAASRRLAETRGAPEARPYNYEPLLRVAATLGLRLSELLGLTWADFEKGDDADAATLSISRQWLPPTRIGDQRLPARYAPPKTKAGERVLAVPADLREELLRLRLASPFSADGDPIFAARSGKPLTHRNVTWRGWEAARDAAGLDPGLVFHDLRHAAASRLIASGLDDAMVADQIGHGDSGITRRVYAHVYDRRSKMAAVRAALQGAVAESEEVSR
jgi:integrase